MPDSIQKTDTIDTQESGSESVSPEHPVTDVNDSEKSAPDAEPSGKVNASSAIPPATDGIEKLAQLPSLADSAAFKSSAAMMAKIGAGFPDIAAMAGIRHGTMAAFDSINKSTLEKFAQLPSLADSAAFKSSAAMMAKIGAGFPDIAAMAGIRHGTMAAFDSIDKNVLEQLTRVTIPVMPQLDIERYSKMFSEIQSHMSATVNQTMALYESAIAQSLGQLREAVAQRNALAGRAPKTAVDLSTLSQRFETAMMDLQWPAPMIDIDFALMQDIITLYNNLPRQEADTRVGHILSRIYDADCLHERLDSWKHYEWIKPRISVLAPAIEAHVRGQYELSIPVLMAQIDGILIENLKDAQWVTQKREEEWITTACENDGTAVGRLAASVFVKAYYQEFDIRQSTVPDLSRNAILHGIDLGYATDVNSLKMILLLDCTIYISNEERRREVGTHNVLETRLVPTS